MEDVTIPILNIYDRLKYFDSDWLNLIMLLSKRL